MGRMHTPDSRVNSPNYVNKRIKKVREWHRKSEERRLNKMGDKDDNVGRLDTNVNVVPRQTNNADALYVRRKNQKELEKIENVICQVCGKKLKKCEKCGGIVFEIKDSMECVSCHAPLLCECGSGVFHMAEAKE